ncbi:MAG: hypothetical protein JOZ38_07230 [Candidatus Eremiobacteraeota bacterium]|nr:hypothetical protein [Candidatus Eremiobacteraeota bacterium]
MTTTTDASGHYCFILPVPGRYRISGGREISYIRVLTADPVEVAIDSGNEYLALLKVWLGIRMIDRAPSDLVRPSQAADYSALHPSSIELQRAPQTLDQALSAVPGVLAAPSLPQAPLPH